MALWKLRPYQDKAVQTLVQLTRSKQFLLLQAATGAGKTLMAAHFMHYFTTRWHFRCLFLAHKAILVRQALERMQASFEDADVNVDCLCASVEKPGAVSGHVIVASPQTLARRLDALPRVDVVVIDECHRVPPKDQSSLYADIITAVTKKRPNARILGITATPWRLGQGTLYDAGSRGHETWWDDLDVRISIRELQEQQWLAPLSVLACSPLPDLASVPVGASGDFREDILEDTLLKPLHLGSAVKAVQDHAEGRRHIAAFCVSIAHARALSDRFSAQGITAAAIDSRADAASNSQNLADFDKGKIRVLCTVGMLTEGWDSPRTDCLLMCRPTLSPALYVQMVGRGLRTAEGKKDCLLLDLSGNVLRHGSPNAPRLSHRASLLDEERELRGGADKGESPRFCPFCEAILPADMELTCPFCRAPLYEITDSGQTFHPVNLDQLEKMMHRGEGVRRAREEKEAREKAKEKARLEKERQERARRKAELINKGEPVSVKVLASTNPEQYQVRHGPAEGARTLKFDLLVEVPDVGRRSVQVILDPEGNMGRKARTFFWALRDTQQFWERCTTLAFPQGRYDMLSKWNRVTFPDELLLKQTSGGFLRFIWKEPKKKKAAKKDAE